MKLALIKRHARMDDEMRSHIEMQMEENIDSSTGCEGAYSTLMR